MVSFDRETLALLPSKGFNGEIFSKNFWYLAKDDQKLKKSKKIEINLRNFFLHFSYVILCVDYEKKYISYSKVKISWDFSKKLCPKFSFSQISQKPRYIQ